MDGSEGRLGRGLGLGLALAAAGVAVLAGPGCERRRSVSGEPLTVLAAFGRGGVAPGEFVTPRAIAADGRSLWVVDRSARVQRIDAATGRCVQYFLLKETTRGYPTGLTVAPLPGERTRLGLYVADTHNHRVLIYAIPPWPEGVTTDAPAERLEIEPAASFGSYGVGPGEFVYPTSVGVLLDAPGGVPSRYYVAEFGGNDRVQAFDAAFKPILEFGEFGVAGGASEGQAGTGATGEAVVFQRPQTVVVDAARGRLVVADSVNHRLGVFTLEGGLVGWVGGGGMGPGEFYHPRGVEVLGDGTVLVGEFGNCRIQRIDLATGRSLGTYGKPGSQPGHLMEPWGFAVLGGVVYVIDARNNRVQGFAVGR